MAGAGVSGGFGAPRDRQFGNRLPGVVVIACVGRGNRWHVEDLRGPARCVGPAGTDQAGGKGANFVARGARRLHIPLLARLRPLTERFGQLMFVSTGCQLFSDRTVRSRVESLIGTALMEPARAPRVRAQEECLACRTLLN